MRVLRARTLRALLALADLELAVLSSARFAQLEVQVDGVCVLRHALYGILFSALVDPCHAGVQERRES